MGAWCRSKLLVARASDSTAPAPAPRLVRGHGVGVVEGCRDSPLAATASTLPPVLRELRVKNFKAWQDTGRIKLAPLTVLFGPNSSGKFFELGIIAPGHKWQAREEEEPSAADDPVELPDPIEEARARQIEEELARQEAERVARELGLPPES
jgi:hypothetical protein